MVGAATGPGPVDRGRAGSKHHVLTDANGIPLAVTLTGGHRNDVTQLLPLLDAVPPTRGRVSSDRIGSSMAVCDRVVVPVYPNIVPTSLNLITVRGQLHIAEERPMTEVGPLHQEHPVEYPEGAPPLGEDEAHALETHLDHGWRRDGARRLSREFTFGNFRDAFGFATRVALLAEREFHHPELTVTWGKVLVTLWTHTVKGLSRNDFIIAAKIDRLR